MAILRESVLYYNPDKSQDGGNTSKAAKLKGVLIQMGVRIRNITPDQVTQQVGYLAGMDGCEEQKTEGELPVIPDEVMVLKNFSDDRLNELLMNLRRAGIPRVKLKAVITDTNYKWTFYELYKELKREHKALTNNKENNQN